MKNNSFNRWKPHKNWKAANKKETYDPILMTHWKEHLIEGQEDFLNQSLTTLALDKKGLPGTGSSLLTFEIILSSVCLIETDTGGFGTGFLMENPSLGPWHCLHVC